MLSVKYYSTHPNKCYPRGTSTSNRTRGALTPWRSDFPLSKTKFPSENIFLGTKDYGLVLDKRGSRFSCPPSLRFLRCVLTVACVLFFVTEHVHSKAMSGTVLKLEFQKVRCDSFAHNNPLWSWQHEYKHESWLLFEGDCIRLLSLESIRFAIKENLLARLIIPVFPEFQGVQHRHFHPKNKWIHKYIPEQNKSR